MTTPAHARRTEARVHMSTILQTPLDYADRLHELTCRAVALELAIIGASREAALNSYGDGLAQLARDLSGGLEQFEREFVSEFSSTRKTLNFRDASLEL